MADHAGVLESFDDCPFEELLEGKRCLESVGEVQRRSEAVGDGA
jgi:hypothetical protein